MKITTKNSKRRSDDDVIVGPTFTAGYWRDLKIARRVIEQRDRDAQAGTVGAPKRKHKQKPAPAARPTSGRVARRGLLLRVRRT